MAVEVGKDNYETEVLKSEMPVLVDFWGPQCHRCLALMPAVDGLEGKYAGKVKVTKLNAAAGNRMLCARLKVLGLPAFLFYKGGVEVKRLAGEQVTANEIEEAIQQLLA